jgi:isoleucyl-tRNA synthetase
VRTRQPLRRALVSAPGWATLGAALREQVAEELNVLGVESLSDDDSGLVDVSVKANFRALGARFGKQTPAVAQAIAGADPTSLVSSMRAQGSVVVSVPEVGEVTVTEDDVIVTETPREGWAVVSEGGESLALDLHLDDALVRAGLAREIVRTLQEGRKSAGLEVSDRIRVWWASTDDLLAAAIMEHGEDIAREVLAIEFANGPGPDDAFPVDADLPASLRLSRAH